MKIMPEEIISFSPRIRAIIDSFTYTLRKSGRGHSEDDEGEPCPAYVENEALKDLLQDQIVDKLLAYDKPKPKNLKAFIIVLTRNVCRDYLRQLKRQLKRDLRFPDRNEYIPKGRPRFRETKTALRKAGARYKVKHLELYQAWCARMSRKRIAKKFGLTEGQVRGRLAYARKKISAILVNSDISE